MSGNLIIVEDEHQHTLEVLKMPENQPGGFHDHVWSVPLYNPYTQDVGDMHTYLGEVWIGEAASKKGKIVVSSVPNVLETADDARRLAAALLAAAAQKDANDRA